MQYVTVGNYAVSTTSGDGIEGVILNVHISGTYSPIQYVVENMPFESNESADAYCLEHGYIQVYKGGSL